MATVPVVGGIEPSGSLERRKRGPELALTKVGQAEVMLVERAVRRERDGLVQLLGTATVRRSCLSAPKVGLRDRLIERLRSAGSAGLLPGLNRGAKLAALKGAQATAHCILGRHYR